jgi:hypothetical protein
MTAEKRKGGQMAALLGLCFDVRHSRESGNPGF